MSAGSINPALHDPLGAATENMHHKKPISQIFLAASCAALLGSAAQAQEPELLSESDHEQAVITGDAAATPQEPKRATLASTLAIPGVFPRLDLTALTQAEVSGDGPEDARFTGRADLFVDVSSEQLGLWKGTLLRTHTELRASDSNASRFSGALWPQNSAAALPITGEGVEVTSIYIAQRVDDSTALIAGKINVIDLLEDDPFFGGWGYRRFQNLAFAAPPSGIIPPTIMGASLIKEVGDVEISALVFDPEDRTGDYWIEDLFETGVSGQLGVKWSGTISGSPAQIGLSVAATSADGLDFEDLLAPPDLAGGTRDGSYSFGLEASYGLLGSPKSNKELGLHLRAALADGNPNLIQSSIIGGISGRGMIAGRPHDRFGVGAYYYNFSDVLQDVTAPLARFDDEAGLEAWYSIALTPNADFALNAQLIDPASGQNDNAFLLGARMGLRF